MNSRVSGQCLYTIPVDYNNYICYSGNTEVYLTTLGTLMLYRLEFPCYTITLDVQ